jgi:hypothetical protein
MKNNSDPIVAQHRLRFRSYVSALRKSVRVAALISLAFSLVLVGSTSLSSTSAHASTTMAQQRVAALPPGATSARLLPGATQPILTFDSITGSKTSNAEASATSSAPTATEPAVAIQRRAVMQTPSGYIATAALSGLTSGSYLVVHGGGAVAAHAPGGEVLWNQPSFQFTEWTGRYPPNNASGSVTPTTPVVQLGVDPVNPFIEAGAHPFDVGDLNGDGVDDVAIAEYFAGVTAIGPTATGTNRSNTYVFVLDGASGALIWSHMYAGYVNNLAIGSGMLVVAHESGNLKGPGGQQVGENGSMSILEGWSFNGGQATVVWTISTGAQWARWLALEKLPAGKIAAAWSNTALGSGSTTPANLLLASVATGDVDWSAATSGYPRFLRFDASRNRLVALEEADPNSSISYAIVGRNPSDGALASTISAADATALNFQLGDLDSDGQAEYVVSDIGYVACPDPTLGCSGIANSGRVRAFDGDAGSEKWSQVRGPELSDPNNIIGGSDIPRPYGLVLTPNATGADVLVGSFMPGDLDIELEKLSGALGLSGPAGTVLWSKRETNLFQPLFMSIYAQDGEQFVRVASSRPPVYGGGISYSLDSTGMAVALRPSSPYQVVRSFNAANGNQVSAIPLLGRIHAVAGTKVNTDNTTDLVVGGESGAVFALDGSKVDDHPIILWRRTVAGPVHKIVAADLDGDGHDEIIVAASHAIEVLESATGNLRYEIASATDFIWDVTTADVNGDGKIDIVVPASTLSAYTGSNGTLLWSYLPSDRPGETAVFSNAIVTAERVVIAQFVSGLPLPTTGTGYNRGVIALNGSSGATVWSDSTTNAVPQLWHGTVGSHLDGVNGSVVGLTWINTPGATPSLAMELRDAATGTILNSLPAPSTFAGNFGSLLVPERGVVAYSYNFSWLVGPTETNKVLGYDLVQDLAEGNFGLLGRRVIEAMVPFFLRVLHQNAPDPTPTGPAPIPAASYNHRVSVDRIYLQDLDNDGSDEIIRAQWDWDGFETLAASTQGFGYQVTLYSDGLDILEVQPVAPPLVGVVSRKVHGGSATFDLLLNSGTPATIEPRAGGISSGDHTLVFSFLNVVSTVSSVTATATTSSGTVPVTVLNASGIGTTQYIVNLSGVPNASHLNVTLNTVTDSVGNIGNVSAHMDVLLGDVNFSARTDSGDVTAVRNHTVSIPDQQTFQFDVNTSGRIDSGDVTVTRNASVTVLP